MRIGASSAGAPDASSRWITSAWSRRQSTIRRSRTRAIRIGPLPTAIVAPLSEGEAVARRAVELERDQPAALLLDQVDPLAGTEGDTADRAHALDRGRARRLEAATVPAKARDLGRRARRRPARCRRRWPAPPAIAGPAAAGSRAASDPAPPPRRRRAECRPGTPSSRSPSMHRDRGRAARSQVTASAKSAFARARIVQRVKRLGRRRRSRGHDWRARQARRASGATIAGTGAVLAAALASVTAITPAASPAYRTDREGRSIWTAPA